MGDGLAGGYHAHIYILLMGRLDLLLLLLQELNLLLDGQLFHYQKRGRLASDGYGEAAKAKL